MKINFRTMSKKVLIGVTMGAAYISAASAAVDTNITDGVTLAGTTTNTVLSMFLTPPLSYIVGLVIFGMVVSYVTSIIKGRRRSKA